MTALIGEALQRSIQSLLAQQQFSLISTLADELDQKVQTQSDAIDRVARNITPAILDNPAALKSYLGDRIGLSSFFSGGLVVADADGRVRGEFPPQAPGGNNAALVATLDRVKTSGRPAISAPYREAISGLAVVSFAAPIPGGGGQVAGVLIGTVPILRANLFGQLVEHRVGESGGLYMVAPESDQIVVSTMWNRILTPAPKRGENRMLDRYREGFEGSGVTVSSLGIEELTSARRMASTGWILVARLPVAEAFQPIMEMKRVLIGSMAGLSLVLMAVLWLVLRAALAPLVAATLDMRDMVGGSRPLEPLVERGADEVRSLIVAFNAVQAKAAAAEAGLREREAVYRTLFQGCRAVELLIDPTDGRIVDANAAAVAYYGWSRAALLTKRISDINILGPEAIAMEMQKARAEERDHFHFRHMLESGDVRDVEVWSGPVTVEGRELLYSLVHDVTDRRRSERDVRRLLAFRRAVLDGAGSLIIATDVDGTIVLFNPTAERWLGYRATELVGHATPVALHDPAELARHAQHLEAELGRTVPVGFEAFVARVLANGRPDTNEWTYIRKDGSRFQVLLTVTALYGDEGELNGFLGIAQDISERLAVEKELHRSNAELEQFAYVASHDLRQPLRMVNSYLTLLARRLGTGLDDESRSYIDFATDGAQRMDRMITDLLAYSRIGRAEAQPVVVSLSSAISRAQQNLQGAISESNAEIVIADGLPDIRGNPAEMERLFQNLIGNAVKFRVPGTAPRVEIGLSQNDGCWVISVRDNGIGIDPALHNRLFQVFARLVNQSEYEGTGIGLASCRKIVEHHGGRIWLDSEVGKGCTFFVELPKIIAGPPDGDQGGVIVDER